MQIKTTKVPESAIEEYIKPMTMDLTALFNMMKDDVLEKLDGELTPEEIIHSIEKLFAGHEEEIPLNGK